MSLRTLKNDLKIKKAGLANAERALKFFEKAKPVDTQAVADTKVVIRDLKVQIAEIEKDIKDLEKRAEKKK